jgi:3-oxoacyl-[acyl-carrier-protein] synthase III
MRMNETAMMDRPIGLPARPSPRIAGIRFSRSSPVNLDDIVSTPAEKRSSAMLRSDGFERVATDDRNIVEMAVEAMRATLADTAIDPGRVTALIFVTESFWDFNVPSVAHRTMPDHMRIRDGLIAGAVGLGLKRAYPYGCWMSACGNLGPSLALAHDFSVAGRHEATMVVLADRLPPNCSRFIENSSSVFGDIAASFLVGAIAGDLQILGVTTHAANNLVNYQGKGDYLRLSLDTKKAIRELARQLERNGSFPIATADVVLFDHFHQNLLELFCDAIGVDLSVVYRGAHAAVGHVFSADMLVALEHLRALRSLGAGTRIALFNIGVCTWTVAYLEIGPAA